ncbi:MAG: hypothetical protein AABX29_03680 [Nanoarchaeota archaeon]
METTESCRSEDDKAGYERWTIENVQKDLVSQGGLRADELKISGKAENYLTIGDGNYKGNNFHMRWVKDNFLVVIVEQEDSELLNGFSNIIGKKPFVRYVHPADNKPTFEWDMKEADKRYLQLAKKFRDKDVRLTWIGQEKAPNIDDITDD